MRDPVDPAASRCADVQSSLEPGATIHRTRSTSYVMHRLHGADSAVERAYRETYDRFARFAFLLIGDADAAADLVQEAFAAALQRGSEVEDVPAYVRGAILNMAKSRYRRNRRWEKIRRLLRELPDDADHGEGVALWASVRELPEGQYVCLMLRFYLDYSYAQIAEALSISEGTAKSQVSRAVQALRLKGMSDRDG